MNNYGPRTFLAFAAFILAAASAGFSIYHSQPIQSVSSVFDENAEEYEVYSVLITERFIKDRVKLLVIQDQTLYYANPDYLKSTTSEERIQDLKKYCPSVDESALRDFEAKHMQPSKLDMKFKLPLRYILINKTEVDETPVLEAGKLVESFYEKYPETEGLISLSKVGFNKDHNQAFVRVEFTFCPLCSFGEKVLLKKEFGTWKIANTFGGWVS